MTWEGRFTFEISSADPDSAAPVWVDFTSRVRDEVQLMDLATGRDNDLDGTEPAVFEVVLDNRDGALTYGNTTSVYAAWWGPGRKCRLRERVTSVVTHDRFTGYIQMPEELHRTEAVDALVTITAIDRLGRLRNGRTFTSALGEYIRLTTDLVAYYPLTEEAEPFNGYGTLVAGPAIIEQVRVGQAEQAQLEPGQGLSPPGGEAGGLRLLTGQDTGALSTFMQMSPSLGGFFSLANTDILTTAFWAATTPAPYAGTLAFLTILGSGAATSTSVFLNVDATTGAWQLEALGDLTGTIDIGRPGDGALFPVGVRIAPVVGGALELWVGGQRFTTTLAGGGVTAPRTASIGGYAAGVDCDLSHVQVYRGTTYAYTDFQAQITMGYDPLERQTTGARVNTILNYAGVPAADRAVDTGASAMSSARLAGKDPLTALLEAETTEQGLLYVDGSGLVTFADRYRLYGA